MNKKSFAVIMAFWSLWCTAQYEDSTEIESFEEVLISADRYGAKRSQSVQEIEVISSKRLEEIQGATLADALTQSGKVFVQKSQMGGGSPVLRGFEASRVLILIDGIRMNNATFRAGHLQDIISIDPFSLEKMEVNFGSGSTLFGSDAMGGALYLKTRDPKIDGSERWIPKANIRFQSATSGIIANTSLEYRGNDWGWLLNLTHSQWGDLRMGSRSYTKLDDDFGLQPYYVEPLSNPSRLFYDSILINPDPKIQPHTGYAQSDVLLKGIWMNKGKHIINLQGSFAPRIPRFDRMQFYAPPDIIDPRPNYTAFNYGYWSYEPQNRALLSYTYEPIEHQQRFRVAHQRFDVGRVSRAFNKPNLRKQRDQINMSTFNYDRVDYWRDWDIRSGMEYVFNHVKSSGISIDQFTKKEITSKSRYADSFGITQATALFSHWRKNWGDYTVMMGARLTYYKLNAAYKTVNPWELPLQDISFSHFAPSFNVGIIRKIKENLLLKTSFNQAFRNPNIDDMSKVFESQRGLKLLLPSPSLRPEFAYTFDLNVNYKFRSKIYIEAGVYHTWVQDLMSDAFGEVAGQDSLEWDGIMTPIYQIQNVGNGYIQGFFASIQYRFLKSWMAKFSITETRGRVRFGNDILEQPLDHIPPLFGQVSLRWQRGLAWLEGQYLFNGDKPLEEYSISGEDNLKYTPGFINGVGNVNSEGNPAWGIWNLRGGYGINKYWKFGIAVENILDLRYRVFASGLTSAGRNISLNVSYTF